MERVYRGGAPLLEGGYPIPGSNQPGCGADPVLLERARPNETAYDPTKVLVPDAISDACGRLAAFCVEGYPVWGYGEPRATRAADLGTGSSVFVNSLINALKLPTDKLLQVHAVDNDTTALAIAKKNVDSAAVLAPRPIEVICEEADYEAALRGTYDIIYFNPPYLEDGDDISHDEAKLAPHGAIYSQDPVQEYARVVPRLAEHLRSSGIALVRLPRESANIDTWLAELLDHDKNARLLLINAGKEGRQGRILAIVKDHFPDAFSEHAYWENYILASRRRREQAKMGRAPIYHDEDCEVVRLNRDAARRSLGRKALSA